jgi:hypothetical protein
MSKWRQKRKGVSRAHASNFDLAIGGSHILPVDTLIVPIPPVGTTCGDRAAFEPITIAVIVPTVVIECDAGSPEIAMPAPANDVVAVTLAAAIAIPGSAVGVFDPRIRTPRPAVNVLPAAISAKRVDAVTIAASATRLPNTISAPSVSVKGP